MTSFDDTTTTTTRKERKAARKTTIVAANVEVAENHMQVFRRLSDPIFNSGAMHGTPGTRRGKSS